jgi:hypothetical protein
MRDLLFSFTSLFGRPRHLGDGRASGDGMSSMDNIENLIIDRLAAGETRPLTLLVSVRRALGGEVFRGDLPRSVDVALKRLVAAREVTDNEGIYSLGPLPRAVR